MNEKLERLFQILAVILIGVAAFFLWYGNTDGLFISAVLGSVCFFLSVRFQVKERLEQRERDKLEEERRNRFEDFSESSSLLDEFTSDDIIDSEQQTTDKGKTTNYL